MGNFARFSEGTCKIKTGVQRPGHERDWQISPMGARERGLRRKGPMASVELKNSGGS